MPEPRTFKVQNPPMRGADVTAWEKDLIDLFNGIGIVAPVIPNGVYGDIDRSYTRSFCYAIGLDPDEMLDHGLTPTVRTFLRHWKAWQAPPQERLMKARIDWRRRLRERYAKLSHEGSDVSSMVQKLIADSWGYHPGVHDGIDLITLPDVPIFAPVDCEVFDVRPGGWWRLGAPTDPTVRGKGDGIVQVEIADTVGPFKEGHHLGFGHMEKAKVRKGQLVKAGEELGRSGFANAWHIHLVLNDGSTTMGIGNLDPRACVDYTKKHG